MAKKKREQRTIIKIKIEVDIPELDKKIKKVEKELIRLPKKANHLNDSLKIDNISLRLAELLQEQIRETGD